MADIEIDNYDYGFSAMTEEEVKKGENNIIDEKIKELIDAQYKIDGLKKIIWPFLEHLKSDPDKPYVFWPNRRIKIEEFQRKISIFLGVK